MAGPTYNEMEAKRLEMIASFREIAAVMKHCVSVIEDYARLSPHTLNAIDPALLPTTLAAATSAPGPAPGTGAAAVAADDGKKVKPKKDKKIKDPNAPKRPPSAYILFQNEVREEIRKKNPEMPYKEVLGIISQMWKDLPETAKKVYDAAYENAHSQYKVKDTNYKHSLEPQQPAPVVVPAAESSDDSDSDSDDSDSDDDTPPAPVVTPAPKPKAAPAPPPAPVPVVSTPAANTSVKKEKKKRKTEEAEVAAALHAVGVPTPEAEKKKRKKKDAAA